MANFIDIFVEDLADGANIPDWQEVFLAEDVKEGSGVEDGSSEDEIEEPVIDVSQCVEIKGDAQKGYYLQFVEDIDDKLKDLFNQNKEKYKEMGLESTDEFKQMIRAEIATEYPSFGGVVTSDKPISNGTEAEAGGNETAGMKTKSSGGTGTYEWPVKKHTTPQDRGHAVTSMKADRESPGGIGSKDHQGMDIAADTGDEIVATAAGTVVEAGVKGGYGNAVVLELDAPINGKKATVTYGHNSELLVKQGDKVTAGQTIAKAGSTGNSTGPHCHFQVNLEGEKEAIDPLHLFTEAQVNSDSSYADNNNPPNGPVKGDGLYCKGGGGGSTSTVTSTSSSTKSTGSAGSGSAGGSGPIIIQPGHSVGLDSGATSPDGSVQEAELNQRLAGKIVRKLQDQGYNAIITHTTEEEFQAEKLIEQSGGNSLAAVREAVNAQNPILAMSIHHDSASSTSTGSSLYWSSYRDWDTEGVYTVDGIWYGGRTAYRDNSPCEEATKSKEFAEVVAEKLKTMPTIPFNEIHERDDSLPAHTRAPCILYEGGYVSNSAEANYMNSDEYMEEASQRIVEGIIEFLGGTVTKSSNKPGPGWVDLKGSSDNQDAKITIGENLNLKEDPKNRFEGSVRVRRLTPKKSVGAYEEGDEAEKEEKEVYNYVPEIPGMGTAMDLSEAMKGTIKGGSLSGSVDAGNLAYLTIPYYDFDLKLHEGHMIVNKRLAKDVLNIFYELYDKKYPMASIEIAENFLDSFDSDKFYADAAKQEEKTEQEKKAQELLQEAKNNKGKNNQQIKEEQEKKKEEEEQKEKNKLVIEDEGKPSIDRSKIKRTSNRNELGQMSADSNNTCCLYYDSSGGAAHITGNAIDINPRYNPKTTNKTSTATYNAQYYVDREHREAWNDEAEAAFIDEESVVYKVFEAYGWTWGGEDGDYGHFEKTDIPEEDENVEQVSIESTYYDLSYVDEKTFNSYVKTGDKRALYVFTLNSTRDVITGAWSFDNSKGDKKFTISKIPVGFRKALNKYTMPMEFLLTVLIHSKDIEFTENLANLGIESQYVVTIKDNVTTKKTITKTTVSESTYNAEGELLYESQGEPETKEVITESTKQEPDVTFIDNWFVRYVNLFPGATEELVSANNPLGTSDVDVIGTKTTSNTNSTNTSTKEEELETNDLGIKDLLPPATNKSEAIMPYIVPTNQPKQDLTNHTAKNNTWPSSEAIRIAMEKRKEETSNQGKEIVTKTELAKYPTNTISKTTEIQIADYSNSIMNPEYREQLEREKMQRNAEKAKKWLEERQKEREKSKGTTTPITPSDQDNKKEQTIDQPNQEQEQEQKKPKKTTTTTTETEEDSIAYEYSSTTGVAYENYRHFVDLYKNSGLRSASNNFVSWITSSMERNLKTVNLVEIVQYLYSKVLSDYYSMSDISFMDMYTPDEFGFIQNGGTGGNSEIPGMIPLKTPILSREQFIEAMNAYIPKGGPDFEQNFAAKAGSIYDTAVAAGVNPELVVVTAKQEQSFKNPGGSNNYWGLGTPNGAASGDVFPSIEEGIKAYARYLESYEEGGEFAEEIKRMAAEREAAGCDPTGYGQPGTLPGMQSIYSWLGKHEYGSSGSGGYYYMDPDRSGCTKIYKTHEEFVTKCQNAGGEHALGTDSTPYEAGQFTAYQVEMKIDFWNEIFGAYGSLS